MRAGRANLRAGRADLRPTGGGDGGTDGRKDGRKDGCMEIPPCVLQDIGPLGPLPKKDTEGAFLVRDNRVLNRSLNRLLRSFVRTANSAH